MPPSAFKRASARWGLALSLAALALLTGRGLRPFLGEFAPFIAAFPVIALAAWRCGLGPSFASIGAVVLGAKYWFIEPVHSFRVDDVRQGMAILVFAFVCALVAMIGEVNRRENTELLNAQEELEDKVKRRTVELDQANQSLSDLTARLLQLQDDERRRIARDLHDSVGQTMALLGINLANVEADIQRLVRTVEVVKGCQEIVRDTSTGLRTLSYLLHPPLLDENGLTSALPWYTQGFAERSGITVDLQLPDELGRLSRDAELAIFRVVQESMTNIHRHSGAKHATIRVNRSKQEISVRVEDDGRGIPADKLQEMASGGTPGVGIRGMRERIRQLGGSLQIDSKGLGKGASVEVRIPMRRAEPVSGDADSGDDDVHTLTPPPAALDASSEGQNPHPGGYRTFTANAS
jgi:signal transduction histidine kinase